MLALLPAACGAAVCVCVLGVSPGFTSHPSAPLPWCPPSLSPQAKGKTSEAITKLCQLAPPVALLVEVDGKGAVVSEREVPTALVHRGDLLKVRYTGGAIALL